MRGVVFASVLLMSVPALAQSVTVCDHGCTEAVDPSAVHGVLGRLFGNPEPPAVAPPDADAAVQKFVADRDRQLNDWPIQCRQQFPANRCPPLTK